MNVAQQEIKMTMPVKEHLPIIMRRRRQEIDREMCRPNSFLVMRQVMLLTLFLCSCLVVPTQSQSAFPGLMNGSEKFTVSSNTNYDNELYLSLDLLVRWKEPSTNKIDDVNYMSIQMVHTASDGDDIPSWLGFGVLVDPDSTPLTPDGTSAFIGIVAQNTVKKYGLGMNHTGSGSMVVFPDDQQTLEQTTIEQTQNGNGDTITTLSFMKRILEDYSQANTGTMQDATIRQSGQNIFSWAVGPSHGFGPHPSYGWFSLDFQLVRMVNSDNNGSETEATQSTQGQSQQTTTTITSNSQQTTSINQPGGGQQNTAFEENIPGRGSPFAEEGPGGPFEGPASSSTTQETVFEEDIPGRGSPYADSSTTQNPPDINLFTLFNIINGTKKVEDFVKGEYDHQVELMTYEDSEFTDTLIFEWKDVRYDGSPKVLSARVVHRVLAFPDSDLQNNPTWIGIGWLDTINNAFPPESKTALPMAGSQCVIGQVKSNQILKYKLGAGHQTGSMVVPLAEDKQTLENVHIAQTKSSDGFWTTILTFEKYLQEPEETPIIQHGENVFLWAIGRPRIEDALGPHSTRGGFVLNLHATRKDKDDDTVETPTQNGAVATTSSTSPPQTSQEVNVPMDGYVDEADYGVYGVINATDRVVKSTDSNYDFEVNLQENLILYWKDPNKDADGMLFAKLEWISYHGISTAPSWLGFGALDLSNNLNGVTEFSFSMAGSDAIIGQVKTNEVWKYPLGENHASTGTVSAYPSTQQTLKNTDCSRTTNIDGSMSTILKFGKKLQEQASQEPVLRKSGENVFLWAVGPGGNNVLGLHTDRGSFRLDFAAAAAKIRSQAPPVPTYPEESETSQTQASEAPKVHGKCSSSDPYFNGNSNAKSVQLTPKLTMHWAVNQETNVPAIDNIASVSVALEYDGEAWIGFAFQRGLMAHAVGSTAVIGVPVTAGKPQLKYNITDKYDVYELQDQTLIESSVQQVSGKTRLTFTKALRDGFNEVLIDPLTFHTFSYAIGETNDFGYHRHRGAFRLNLSQCKSSTGNVQVSIGSKPSSNNIEVIDDDRYYGADSMDHTAEAALTAHAIFAVLAWALAVPMAVSAAWFRTLVPTSWIYYHVFGNVATFFFTFLAVLLGIGAVGGRPTSHHFSHPHHSVGIALFVLVTIQVVNGFFRPAVERKEDNSNHPGIYDLNNSGSCIPRTSREIWHQVHRGTGWIMLGFAMYQIHSGLELFSQDFAYSSESRSYLGIIFWVYVLLFTLFCISLKLWTWFFENSSAAILHNEGAAAAVSTPQVEDSDQGYHDDSAYTDNNRLSNSGRGSADYPYETNRHGLAGVDIT